MRVLSIDTTAPAGSVALSDGERLIAQEQQAEGGTHAERLLYSIQRLFESAGWNASSVEGIAVAIGPGSFTGLRIGIATAKALSIAGGIPIAGVSSLAALAQNGRDHAGTVVPLIDARRGELYASAWRADGQGRFSEVMPEGVAPPGTVAEMLSALPGELLLVGDGARAYGAALLHALGDRAQIAQGPALLPQAHHLALLAQKHLEGGGDDVAALLPNYIRRSDAEIGFRGNA